MEAKTIQVVLSMLNRIGYRVCAAGAGIEAGYWQHSAAFGWMVFFALMLTTFFYEDRRQP